MSKRLINKIASNKAKILRLANENIDLSYELEISKAKRFSEKQVNMGSRKNPIMKTAKWMHWFEWFKDESESDKPIRIERSQIIEIDGERYVGWGKVLYYRETDF